MLDLDYKNKDIHFSMLRYVQKVLVCFNHKQPKKLHHQPHLYAPPSYEAKIQYSMPEDIMPGLNKQQTKFIQVTRRFLYYAQVVDSTMLTAFSALATEQTKPTITILHKTEQFLYYTASNSEAALTYKASDMTLARNASYLN